MRKVMRLPSLCLLAGLAITALPIAMGAQNSPEDATWQAVSPTVEAQTAPEVKWLLASEGQSVGQIVSDKRFEPFLATYFPNTEVKFWSTQGSVKRVSDVAVKYLRGSESKVLVERNRYVTLSGCIASFCQDKGLLWVDAHVDADTSQPTLAFAAIDVRAGSAHLWLFSNKDFYDSPFTIPQDLRVNVGKWLASRGHDPVKRIDQASLADPTGQQEMDVAPAILGVPLSLMKLAGP